ncbi:MAG: hypothetical protein HDS50_00105 [Bacteroides sp.]|nr:hypothetical protein [Bacteroides sp.]
MKESIKGMATSNSQTEFDKLLAIAKKVAELRDEFEQLSMSQVCDGIYSDNFAEAQSRLNTILLTDLNAPMHTCVIEQFVNQSNTMRV